MAEIAIDEASISIICALCLKKRTRRSQKNQAIVNGGKSRARKSQCGGSSGEPDIADQKRYLADFSEAERMKIVMHAVILLETFRDQCVRRQAIKTFNKRVILNFLKSTLVEGDAYPERFKDLTFETGMDRLKLHEFLEEHLPEQRSVVEKLEDTLIQQINELNKMMDLFECIDLEVVWGPQEEYKSADPPMRNTRHMIRHLLVELYKIFHDILSTSDLVTVLHGVCENMAAFVSDDHVMDSFDNTMRREEEVIYNTFFRKLNFEEDSETTLVSMEKEFTRLCWAENHLLFDTDKYASMLRKAHEYSTFALERICRSRQHLEMKQHDQPLHKTRGWVYPEDE
ncbi:hypothetical protein BJ741DRAFT_584297 [Chytriomyces cf. hyalinus JEL632]|nr:hypothetical protein BJ741DRAFT_584297 [Chytriomyces cf. hyalinus JEL632]